MRVARTMLAMASMEQVQERASEQQEVWQRAEDVCGVLGQQKERRNCRKAKKRDTSASPPPALLTRLDCHSSLPLSTQRPLDSGPSHNHFVSRTVTVIW